MTTPEAARAYLAQHAAKMVGRGFAVHNPHDKPLEELPVIYGFNNGGSQDWWHAQLLAEDGWGLGSHICSHEGYMLNDLGILEGTRPDRHEHFREHYPDGYRMDFVTLDDVRSHEALKLAFERNKALAEEAAKTKEPN